MLHNDLHHTLGAVLVLAALSGCATSTPQATISPSPSAITAPSASPTVAPPTTVGAARGQAFDAGTVGTDPSSPAAFSSVLDIPSMQVGVYHLQAGATDPQDSHTRDEVYVVLDGSGVLHTSDLDSPVSAGSIAFVRAGVPHQFMRVESRLTLVVVFAKAAGGADEPPVVTADATSLAQNPSPTANLFRRFLKVPSITGGAYLLPLGRGGDRSQTHQVDELNVVISGTGVLRVGADDMPYGPGSLIFVPAEVGHAFHDLGSDSVVLIFWPANP